MKQLGEFWRGRVELSLDEHGVPYDARDAAVEARVLVEGRARPGWIDACDCLMRAQVLEAFRSDPRFGSLAILFKRVSNILAKNAEPVPAALDRARLVESVERDLAAALDQARAKAEPLWEKREYAKLLPALLEMEHAIHAFFDGVMVNADDAAVRANRLRLLTEVRELFLRGWDLSKVVVEGEKA
jgi:glycyl-tRNA synthetase beta chain